MRKNTVKKSIKKVAKVAQKNPTAAVAVTATVTGFGIFGMVEAGIIIKNKTQEKIAEIKEKKEKKEQDKGKKENEKEEKDKETTEDKKEDEKKENNENKEG